MASRMSVLSQEGLWRVGALLRRRAGGPELDSDLLPAIVAASADDGDLVRLVVNRPPTDLDAQVAAMLPPLFDTLLEFWFAEPETAQRFLDRVEADPVVRSAAAAAVDADHSLLWLSQVFAIKPEEGRSRVKFLAGGEPAEGWEIEDAQRYWRDVHPVVAQTVPDVWALLTRYVQFHGAPVTEKSGTLGRWLRVPMCAEIGFAHERDFLANFSDAEYLKTIRPDEEKFSRPNEMLRFLSGEEHVLLQRA